MACVSKIGSLYEMVTKNVIVSTTNTVFGINPRAWIALPCEGLILLKIRQVVPTAGSALPVQIAVPANSTVSTVGADTCCPVTGVNVVNPINVAVTGAAMVNGTERLLYFNKVRGVLRLMDCCVPVAAAIVKNMIPAFPFFPFGKKGIKILYRSAGNRIPVAGLFHITFF